MPHKLAKIKKRKHSLLYTPVGIGFLAALLLFLGYSTYGVYTKWSDAHAKFLETKESYTATVARHDAISEDLETLSTDRGKEEIVREKFNIVKEGEGVVVLPGEPYAGVAQDEAEVNQQKSFWQFFRDLFRKQE